MLKRFMKALLMSLILIGLFVACNGKTEQKAEEQVTISEEKSEEKVEKPEAEEGAEEKEMVDSLRMWGGDFGIPNPFKHHIRGPGIFKCHLLYDSLLEKDESGLIPWLAESYEVSEDGKTLKFTISKDAKWHDGKPLTVDDVIFTFNYYEEHTPVVDYTHVAGDSIIENIEKTGDDEITIRLKNYGNTHLEKIATTRIIPKHIWEGVEDPIAYEGEGYIVGSGPYRMTHYSPEQGSYRFEAVEDYFRFKPAAKALEWIPVSDIVLSFNNEEIDLAQISPDLLSNYENKEEYTTLIVHSLHNYRLMMNADKVEEFKDVNVRKAIAYAIDRNNLVEKIERGFGTVGNMGYLLPTHDMYNPNVEQYEHDLEKAKELLEGKEIEVTILTSDKPKEIKISELIKLDLEEIGIKASISSVDMKTRDQALVDGNYEMCMVIFGGMGSDADMLRNNYYSGSAGRLAKWYKNDELDQLLMAQSSEANYESRKEMVFKAQEIIADEVPVILLYGNHDINVYRPEKYDGWMTTYDHTKPMHPKLSFMIR